jgi:hypothetical protein
LLILTNTSKNIGQINHILVSGKRANKHQSKIGTSLGKLPLSRRSATSRHANTRNLTIQRAPYHRLQVWQQTHKRD